MNVDAGKLDKRIQIIRVERVQDSAGYWTETEVVVREPWAQFTRTSGTELQKANADMTEIRARFLVRSSSVPLDRKMSVRYAGEDYEILFINDYGDQHEYTEIWCQRRTLEGT